jgi:hypothetical protein
MTIKSILLVGALALSTLSIAGAKSAGTKSYDITLSVASKVGNAQLPAGEYKLKVDGANVVFTNVNTAKQVTATAKVDTVEKKYDVTAVDTTMNGKEEQINSIELGGSKTKLEFGSL